MTTKPIMQKPIAIKFASKAQMYVSFWASPDAAKEFEQFGRIFKWGDDSEKYSLYINGRFDFDKVVAYIENYH